MLARASTANPSRGQTQRLLDAHQSRAADADALSATAPAVPTWSWLVAGSIATVVGALVAFRQQLQKSTAQGVQITPVDPIAPQWYDSVQETYQQVALMATSGEKDEEEDKEVEAVAKAGPTDAEARANAMLQSLCLVRQELQTELANQLHPTIKKLTLAEPEQDYQSLDLASAPGSAARDAYIARIQEVAKTKPYLLIAHHTLWEGMAEQMIKIMGVTEGITVPTGKSQNTAEFRLRAAIVQTSISLEDRLMDVDTLSEGQKEEIVGEGEKVFNLTIALMKEAQDPELMALYDKQLESISATFMVAPVSSEAEEAKEGLTDEQKAEQEAEEEQAFLRRIDEEVRELTGEGLDALLSPAKVVRIEKELLALKTELAECTDETRRVELQKAVKAKADESLQEKRGVMKGWLRTVFRGQAALTTLGSFALAYDCVPGVEHVDLPLRALGFWSWWLLTIPSLRAIKPLVPQEKAALDWSFVGTLLASLLVPFATKEPGNIWLADAAVVAASYGVNFALGPPKEEEKKPSKPATPRGPVSPAVAKLKNFGTFAATALDFGTGRERGTVETENKTGLEKLLEEKVKEKVEGGKGEKK